MSGSAPFMLRILDALNLSAPQVGELLGAIREDMSREERQAVIGLTDRKSFRSRYLKPALPEGRILKIWIGLRQG